MPSKRMETIPVASIRLSRFNTRRTRPEADIKALAERISRNGFEATRAPWVYPAEDGFEVFAGGTRVEAARRAGLAEAPAFIHEGFAWEEIARLADEDNENDEYHKKVPIVDLWAEYHRLNKEEGWTHRQIAKAKHSDEATVSLRIKMHTSLPKLARKATLDGILDEGHLTPVLGITLDVQGLEDWITNAQAQTELVKDILDKFRGKSAGEKPTVKHFRESARQWKELITAAEAAFKSFDSEVGNWQAAFVAALVKSRARTVAAVDQAKADVLKAKQAEIEAARRKIDTEADANAKEQARLARINALTACMAHGDARELIRQAPPGFHLLLTDPPYGQEHQSQRRVVTPKKAIIANDERAAALDLIYVVLTQAYPLMADDATAFVFTGWRNEHDFIAAIKAAGFTIKGSYVWVKNNHGTGDLSGTFAPKHERILHAVKGKPVLRGRPADVLNGKDAQDSEHPNEKPRDLLRVLIEATTDRDQVVVDPFAGSGNVLFEAHALGRKFFGIEIEEDWHRRIVSQLHALATKEGAEADGRRLAG